MRRAGFAAAALRRRPRLSSVGAQAGLTLVELMVALVLGLLILAGLVTMFANTSSARGEIDKASRQIENGRFAMQALTEDIRHAGYFGALANSPAVPDALPDPCTTVTANVQAAIGVPLQGYAGETTAALMTARLPCLDAAAGYKPGTAVLVVRRAGTGAATVAATAGVFNIQVSGCPGDAEAHTLDVASATFGLHSNGAPGCTPITAAPAALLTPYMVHLYFVSTCSGADCSAAGANSVPTLKRIDITPTSATPTAVVDGIDNLQLEYGLDAITPFDGAPDTYTATPPDATKATGTPAPTTTGHTWNNAMSVRVHLLARNIDASAGYTDTKTYALGPVSVAAPGDAFKRHAYNAVVRLNNPAGRRE